MQSFAGAAGDPPDFSQRCKNPGPKSGSMRQKRGSGAERLAPLRTALHNWQSLSGIVANLAAGA
ncbi:hypothetical protein GCM10011335_18990 [Aureimonas glaciei]|uniref:Uncharacterized protein n=1 Tax=Aureimonas glaciei TaxID=1776957 RepID=A0A916XWA7_9HYPH|nr:hypothetical protein GCM10011335_18990 [Aureimonas glaciei]